MQVGNATKSFVGHQDVSGSNEKLHWSHLDKNITIQNDSASNDNTARTGVLPREVRFDCAGPVFYDIRDVVHLPRWMTRFVSKTRSPKS